MPLARNVYDTRAQQCRPAASSISKQAMALQSTFYSWDCLYCNLSQRMGILNQIENLDLMGSIEPINFRGKVFFNPI